MSQPNPTELNSAAAETATHAIKVAKALHVQLAAAPKPASPDLCKQAAELMVTNRWTSHQDVEKVAQMLADPTTAVSTLFQVVKAATDKILELSGDRLAAGTSVPAQPGQKKQASAAPVWGSGPQAPESDADQIFYSKIMSAAQTAPR